MSLTGLSSHSILKTVGSHCLDAAFTNVMQREQPSERGARASKEEVC